MELVVLFKGGNQGRALEEGSTTTNVNGFSSADVRSVLYDRRFEIIAAPEHERVMSSPGCRWEL